MKIVSLRHHSEYIHFILLLSLNTHYRIWAHISLGIDEQMYSAVVSNGSRYLSYQ